MAKLTARGVKGLTNPGSYGDGGGLYMVVRSAGSNAWVMRAVIDGRRRDILDWEGTLLWAWRKPVSVHQHIEPR